MNYPLSGFCIPYFLALLILISPISANAQQEPDINRLLTLSDLGLDEDDGFLDRFRRNLRITVDIANRVSFPDSDGPNPAFHAIGVDAHKVFSNEQGDIGTLNFQLYLVRLNNMAKRPSFFEGPDDWELTARIMNFNYTGLPGEGLNIRVGHFEIPYGLEYTITTNGTLRQYTSGPNLGQKTGWGIGLNGQIGKFNYETGITFGDQMEWSNYDQYSFSGRIGTLPDRDLEYGWSWYYAENNPGVEKRFRTGIDALYHYGRWTSMGEFSYGYDKGPDRDVMTGLVEQNYALSGDLLLLYAQIMYRGMDTDGDSLGWDNALSSNYGIRLEVNNRWALSAQISQVLEPFRGGEESTTATVQTRFRF